jgi:CheY-like chemotaxis protein
MTSTVLIVEDEVLLREAIGMDFEDLGFITLTARDCEEALQVLAEASAVDLLFTDIRMPGEIDGLELARRARQQRPELKVIYATGSAPDGPALVDGGVIVSKPFRLDDLKAALEKVGLRVA